MVAAAFPPFEITLPSAGGGQLVFASPHSGSAWPDDFRPAPGLAATSLRSAEDALVDRLIATAPSQGAALIVGRISRAYVDLNREETELDPTLIADCPTGPISPKTAAGFGVVPRSAGDGAALYDRRLDLAEVEARLTTVHRPYHAALAGLMQAARERHGASVLIDWHSMPSRAAMGRLRGTPGPDVVLGDRHGLSCDARLSRRLKGLFEAAGCRVALNQPYAGGYSTQIWGRPCEGFQSIQIELNRSLYLDESTGGPGSGFDRCQKVIARVIAGLCAESPTD